MPRRSVTGLEDLKRHLKAILDRFDRQRGFGMD